MITRIGTPAEHSDYCPYPGQSLMLAEKDGAIVGWCVYAGDTIYLIESYARGAGSALLAALPQIKLAYHICADSAAFWTKHGFSRVAESRNYARP